MANDQHHEHLIKEVAEIFKPILSESSQAIYIYLDDTHKICNQNFAELLGYKTVNEWIENENPVDDVVESDQNSVIEAYGKASEELKASFLTVGVKTKEGIEVKVDLIMAPFSYKGEVFVVHFLNPLNL